ncbi:hypothetical protein D8S93_21205 [Vibrio sp. VGrn 2]|nr:hypothetical protein [Vibrio sp. VGrn 2]
MTIYTASREPILWAGRLTSTGFKRKPPKQKPKKAEPLAMGFGFFVCATSSLIELGLILLLFTSINMRII